MESERDPFFSYPHRDITRKERTSTKTCFEYQTEHYRANSIKVIMSKILKSKKGEWPSLTILSLFVPGSLKKVLSCAEIRIKASMMENEEGLIVFWEV